MGGEPGQGEGIDNGDTGGAPAGGGGCGGGHCDVYQQCGCAPGEACDLDVSALDTGATECRQVTSPGQTAANCDANEACAAGYTCLGSPGQCRKMCDEDGDCGSGRCVVQVIFENDQGELEDVPNAHACTKPCVPDSAFDSGCPRDPAMGCRVYTDDPDDQPESGDEYDYTDCTEAGSGANTFDCSANDDADCLAGFGCYVISFDDGTEANQCRQICAVKVGGVQQTNQCGTGTCNAFATPSVVGDVEYGVCF